MPAGPEYLDAGPEERLRHPLLHGRQFGQGRESLSHRFRVVPLPAARRACRRSIYRSSAGTGAAVVRDPGGLGIRVRPLEVPGTLRAPGPPLRGVRVRNGERTNHSAHGGRESDPGTRVSAGGEATDVDLALDCPALLDRHRGRSPGDRTEYHGSAQLALGLVDGVASGQLRLGAPDPAAARVHPVARRPSVADTGGTASPRHRLHSPEYAAIRAGLARPHPLRTGGNGSLRRGDLDCRRGSGTAARESGAGGVDHGRLAADAGASLFPNAGPRTEAQTAGGTAPEELAQDASCAEQLDRPEAARSATGRRAQGRAYGGRGGGKKGGGGSQSPPKLRPKGQGPPRGSGGGRGRPRWRLPPPG